MTKISEMFDYFPGNHGLTEEIVYNYQPTSSDDRVPIFSGSQNNITPIGYIRRDAHNNKGGNIVYFEGPCIILTKDGSAGLLTYRNKDDGIFTINHHACILKLKPQWAGKVDPKWFALRHKRRFRQYVTSKADNAVFSTEWFDRIDVDLPDYDTQLRQKDKITKVVSLAESLDYLCKRLEQLVMTTRVVLEDGDEYAMDDLFHFRGGNTGLTEEFVYRNQPTNEDESVPILTAATLERTLMGHVSRNAQPSGNNLKAFQGPCILVARKGRAGTMTHIESGEFTTNDDAYVLEPKQAWKDKVNLRWFMYEYQELFHNLVTSKSDNATFNKDYAERQTIVIPDIAVQNRLAERLLRIDSLIAYTQNLKKKVERLIDCQIA